MLTALQTPESMYITDLRLNENFMRVCDDQQLLMVGREIELFA